MSNSANPGDNGLTRILLVDDNEDLVRALTDFLQRRQGLRVVSALSGAEQALAQVQELQPHVILMDLDMRDLNGLQVIPRLRRMMPRVGIIALTLWDGSAYRQAVLAAGADELVSKAELVRDLLPAIHRVTHAQPLAA